MNVELTLQTMTVHRNDKKNRIDRARPASRQTESPTSDDKQKLPLDLAAKKWFWKFAFELWGTLLSEDRLPQFDRRLSQAMRKHPSFGKRDRFWYSELLFAAMRFGYLAAFFDVVSQKYGDTLSGEMAEHLPRLIAEFQQEFPNARTVVAYWRTMPPGRFFGWILLRYHAQQAKGATLLQNLLGEAADRQLAHFRLLQSALAETATTDSRMLWHGLPLWYEPHLGDRAARSKWEKPRQDAFIDNHERRPPLWLRLNHPEQRAEILQELENHDFAIETHDLSLRIQGSKGIFELAAYKQGQIAVQDLASQRIGACVQAKPGQMVWDCCAGGGGKTLQIATMLANRGAVYASDIREYKLEELRKRTRAANFQNVRTLIWQGEQTPEFGKEVSKRGGFDWVLVDAPCSSSGTWRRNPDAKFRFVLSEIADFTRLQLQLLHRASAAVRPGGKLVYAVCSWFPEECENLAAQFLRENPVFRPDSQELFGSPYEDADTMFAAVFTRVADDLP